MNYASCSSCNARGVCSYYCLPLSKAVDSLSSNLGCLAGESNWNSDSIKKSCPAANNAKWAQCNGKEDHYRAKILKHCADLFAEDKLSTCLPVLSGQGLQQ